MMEVTGLPSGNVANAYRPTSALIEPSECKTPEALQQELTKWAAACGWIARESAEFTAARNIGDVDKPDQGMVLDAELTLGLATLQIRRLPSRWVLTRITEAEGDQHLADDRLVVTINHGVARYRRYWLIPENGAAKVIACRLVALEEKAP